MKYIIRFLSAGILPLVVNIFIFLWHFDLRHFIGESDIVRWTKDTEEFEPPIDF